MQASTLRTLAWLATILLVIGGMLPTAMAQLALFGLSGLLSLAPSLAGSGKFRLVGAILLFASFALMLNLYPEAQHEYQIYTSHARQS